MQLLSGGAVGKVNVAGRAPSHGMRRGLTLIEVLAVGLVFCIVTSVMLPFLQMRDPYSLRDSRFAYCAVRLLAIILVVAIVACIARNRLMFALGSLGSFLGYVVPVRREMVDGTAEAILMRDVRGTGDHMLWWGIVGALIGCSIAFLARVIPGRVASMK